jgi:hypothetical protein
MMCFLIKFYKIWDEKQHKHPTWAFDATTHNNDKHQQDKAIVTIVDPSFILLTYVSFHSNCYAFDTLYKCRLK